MYHTQSYYHHNLGTAGHRAAAAYNYPLHYAPNYYPPQLNHVQPVYQPYAAPYVAPQPVPAPPADDAVNGGINPVLEYDLNNMSTFLSWCTFGMLKQNKSPTKEFDGLIVSVLFATRLPKSTIIIALEYMNQRFSNTVFDDLSESEIFPKLVIALILANKFNDDNTFTNRSWCGATGLKVDLLNREEKTWLFECKWQLNVVNFTQNIQTLEECWKTWMDKYTGSPEQPVANAHHQSPASNHGSSPVLASSAYLHYGAYQPVPPYSSSIPSSPVYDSYTPSPPSSSPVKYAHDSIWSKPNPPQNANIWSYTPTYQYVPQASADPAYMGSANRFVGYANPYYGYNMAHC